MADVFISYHETSAGELAGQIADALDRAGISCWCARRDLPPGSNFARDIPPQIDACRVFLLILNNSVYESLDVENELGMAFERLKKREAITILPFETEDVTRQSWLRYYLFHIQSVKIPPSDPQRIEKLIREIKRIPGILPRQPQPVPVPYIQTPQTQPVQPPQPATIIQRGQCGEHVNYTLDEKGVLTISGYGPMWNYNYNGEIITTPWYPKRGIISKIRIHNGVTSIGAWAFRDCDQITEISIPDSVTRIGGCTFGKCRYFTTLFIPDNVNYIGVVAFYYFPNLENVSVPAKAQIDSSAFPKTTAVIRRP